MLENNHKFNCKLISKTVETEDTVTLRFDVGEGGKLSFIPGQYVIAYIKGDFGIQGKAYTISSIPSDNLMALTVKKIGKFSSALHDLKIGSIVTMEGPKGSFFPDDKCKESVFLAAGIGITPFLSIIRAYTNDDMLGNRKIYLFYSNKTKEDISFFDEFNEICSKNKNIKIFYHLTRQKIKDAHIKEFSRIDINGIRDKLTNLNNKDYFICGPIRFVLDMRRALLDEGVDEFNIHTESFY
jgi:ferredoxin-NADP reductase